jgi:hypothetical protein
MNKISEIKKLFACAQKWLTLHISEAPNVFLTSQWQPTIFMLWQNFKKYSFADCKKFKGGFSNFQPTFFRIHSPRANQIYLINGLLWLVLNY